MSDDLNLRYRVAYILGYMKFLSSFAGYTAAGFLAPDSNLYKELEYTVYVLNNEADSIAQMYQDLTGDSDFPYLEETETE